MNPARPNIILITTDQQGTNSLECYGAGLAPSPCLDAQPFLRGEVR